MNDETYRCKRCGFGIDDDGDGDCAFCCRLSEQQLAELKRERQDVQSV